MQKRTRAMRALAFRKKCAAALLAVLVLAAMLAGCSGKDTVETAPNRVLPVVNVGCDTYPPFSYVDVDGNMTGIDVELATEAFQRMGYQPHFVIINWEEKKQLLHDGTIDCAWSSFSMDGREDEYQWAGPYMKSHQVVTVNTDSDIYTLQDLEDKVIAVQSTTKPEDIIRSHDGRLPQLRKVISVQKRDLIFSLLGKGYVDALAAHDTSVEEFMKECGLEFRVLDEPLLTVGLGVAFDKDDTRGLSAALSQTFEQMLADGTTKSIIGKYLTDVDSYLGGDYEN